MKDTISHLKVVRRSSLTPKRVRAIDKELIIEDREDARMGDIYDLPVPSTRIHAEGKTQQGKQTIHDNFGNKTVIETPMIDWGTYDVENLISKLVLLSETLTGMQLYPYQIEFQKRVFRSVLTNDGAEITALFARQSGKTETIACAVQTLLVMLPLLADAFPEQLEMYKHGIMIGLFAPSVEQASTTHARINARFDSRVMESVLQNDLTKKYSSGVLQVNGRNSFGITTSLCRLQTAAKQSKIESKTYHLIIIEECVYKDTKVLTPYGSKRIKNLFIGDTILTYDQDNILVQDEVTKKWNRGFKQTFKIETESGTLIATENHKLFTDMGWKTVKEIIDNSITLCYTNNTQGDHNETVNSGNTTRRWKHWIWRQKIFTISKIQSCTLVKTIRVCLEQIRNTKKLLWVSTKTSRESWERKLPFKIFNTIITNFQRLLRYSLYTGKEDSQQKLAITANTGRNSILVSGRWWFNRKRKNIKNINTWFFIRRATTISSFFKNIWCYCFNTIRKEMPKILPTIKCREQKYITKTDTKIYSSKYAIQGLHIGDTKGLSNLSGDIYNEQENSNNLFRRLQEGIKSFIREVRQSKRIQKKNSPQALPIKIIRIKKHKIVEVWDIETKKTHTFIANGILVHNCQEVDKMKILKSIHPMGASINATIVKIGTPIPNQCEFHEAIQRNRIRDLRINNSKYQNHFEFTYRVVQKYNVKYKAFINKEIERQGLDSDYFRMAYLLEWILEKGMMLTQSQFEEYMETSQEVEYFSDGFSTYVAGLDLAKTTDSTVLTIAKLKTVTLPGGEVVTIKQVVNWLELDGVNWEDQYQTIVEWVRVFRIAVLAVDATGVGDPIAERLQNILSGDKCNVIPIKFSSQSKHEMATMFYTDLRRQLIQIPSGHKSKHLARLKHFKEQLFACEKRYQGRFLQLAHPEGERGAKDDYVDSLLLMLLAANNISYNVAKNYNNIFTGNDNKVSKKQMIKRARAKLFGK